MTVRVGYITKWRRTIFLSIVLSIILFGLGTSIGNMLLGKGIQTNMLSVLILIGCIALVLIVIADKWEWFEGEGTADISNGKFSYNDKKKHISVNLSDIKKVDIEKIVMGENTAPKVLAYKLLIKTNKKKYYIESERAYGREYNEVDLHRLYIYLQENLNKYESGDKYEE
ncbi:MAG: hypothetical protein E7263_07250 [Lachnospiraceae bacterium]|nr:hypothetical protein [Lachnospiraceae bacterium]